MVAKEKVDIRLGHFKTSGVGLSEDLEPETSKPIFLVSGTECINHLALLYHHEFFTLQIMMITKGTWKSEIKFL